MDTAIAKSKPYKMENKRICPHFLILLHTDQNSTGAESLAHGGQTPFPGQMRSGIVHSDITVLYKQKLCPISVKCYMR